MFEDDIIKETTNDVPKGDGDKKDNAAVEDQTEVAEETDVQGETENGGAVVDEEAEAEDEEQQSVEEVSAGRTLRTRDKPADFYWELAGKPRRGHHANLIQEDEGSYDDTIAVAFASALETGPRNLEEAFAGEFADEWRKAWADEIAQLEQKKVWELVPRPKDKPVIPNRCQGTSLSTP